MRHPELDNHDSIAWDFDGTLRDGPNSEFFLDYIKAHPEKTHFIITFRNRSWADEIHDELIACDFDPKAIVSVESCPEPYFNCFHARWRGENEFSRRVMNEMMGEIAASEFQANADAYVNWKGLRASELGCTILVDDIPRHVLPGCEKHDVAFLDANHAIPKWMK